MLELTPEDIAILKEEIDFISNNMGINELRALENDYVILSKYSEGIKTCTNACNKINELNKKIRLLQSDTVSVCKKIETVANNS